MAQRPIRFALSVQSLERWEVPAEEHPLLEFEFADSPSADPSLRPQRLPPRAASLKERIALWLERKL